jgi:cytochrome oxidase Cu insertion factor (SCO1/SenC/PrrC family)
MYGAEFDAIWIEGNMTTEDVVTAQRFELRASDGSLRGAWAFASDENEQAFFLCDRHGDMRATLMVRSDGGPALVLHDQVGRMRAEVTVSKQGSAAVVLRDWEERGRAALSMEEDGPTLVLTDDVGKERVEVSLRGKPMVGLRDGSERLRAVVTVTDDGVAAFGLLDEEGTLVWQPSPYPPRPD